MTITVNTKAYNADVPSTPNSVPYNGPAQTLTTTDKIDLSRTAPKPTALFSGVARSRVRIARTLTLTNALTPTGLLTFDLAMNVPVGTAGADVDAALSDLAAGLGQQWAKDLAKQLDISA